MDPVTSNWRYFNTSTTSSGGLEADLRNDASIASKVQQFHQRRGRNAMRVDDSQSSSQVCPHCSAQQGCCRRHRWQWHAASAPPSQDKGNGAGINASANSNVNTNTNTNTNTPASSSSGNNVNSTPPLASVLPSSNRLSSEVSSYFDGCCYCC